MYPATVIGRILACIAALVGAGMMGMLVSVLVDRYQRVHQRKMYVPNHELPLIRMDSNPQEQLDRREHFFSFLSERFPSTYHRMKQNSNETPSNKSYKVQFIVSFNEEEVDDQEKDTIITTIKGKINETISASKTNMNLKLIYNTNDKLWTTTLNQ